jgi:uncharacterized protein YehS (DUF1456 family)
MKRINVDVLRRGDVILSTTNEKISKIVRAGIDSDVSHAMICVAPSSVMDSTGNGVHSRNPQKIFFEDDCAVYILRLKEKANDQTISKVINYIRSETATPYAKREAVVSATLLKGLAKGGRKQFCSRLVARAYASAGIELHPNPDFCNPDDLKHSPALEIVENALIEVSEEEIAMITRGGDATEGMALVTNNLLELAKKVKPDLFCLNDIEMAVILQPELDFPMANAYRESGYLDYWKVEATKYPWRYDLKEMFKIHQALKAEERLHELVHYCNQTLAHEAQGAFAHWENNAAMLKVLISHYPRETFKLLQNLYITLAERNKLRLTVIHVWKEATRL